jgi:hypothetical protein
MKTKISDKKDPAKPVKDYVESLLPIFLGMGCDGVAIAYSRPESSGSMASTTTVGSVKQIVFSMEQLKHSLIRDFNEKMEKE